MNRNSWTAKAPYNEVSKRAAGRKRYNERRQMLAGIRRILLLELMAAPDFMARGWQTKAAEVLKVNRGTISRDVKFLHQNWLDAVKSGDIQSKLFADDETLGQVNEETSRMQPMMPIESYRSIYNTAMIRPIPLSSAREVRERNDESAEPTSTPVSIRTPILAFRPPPLANNCPVPTRIRRGFGRLANSVRYESARWGRR